MTYNKDNPLRVCSLCAGYDSQCLALERIKENNPDFEYELVAWAEFDPQSNSPLEKQPAVLAHNALFPQWKDRNWGDLTKIDWERVPDFDMLFASVPCQSISAAGLQHGFAKGSGTRSSIIWNVHDCVRIKQPKYIIMENVSAILSNKFFPVLKIWMDGVERMGYVNFMPKSYETPWNGGHTKDGCMNSKYYGIAQNRERWFMVSIRCTDEEPNPRYQFPKPFKLETCLADVLEEDAEESLFLRDEMLARFCIKSIEQDSESTDSQVGDDDIEEEDYDGYFFGM